MKNIIIIDGYNAIQRTKGFARAMEESLEAARAAFVGGIKNYSARKRTFDEMIVVFDSRRSPEDGSLQGRYRDGAVSVVFSSGGESADELIKSLLRDGDASRRITVVSDDNYVINSARANRADTMSCKDFAQLISASGKEQHSERNARQLELADIEDINEQLKKEWRIK